MCERKLWSVILVCRLRVASRELTWSSSSIAFLSVKHSAWIVVSALGVRELGLGGLWYWYHECLLFGYLMVQVPGLL